MTFTSSDVAPVGLTPGRPAKHPAKFSDEILDALDLLLTEYGRDGLTLDPFAGVGRVHELGLDSIGIELEPEWACQHPRNQVGNALHLLFPDGHFRRVVVSPAYGTRMADHHDAQEKCRNCRGLGITAALEACPKCGGLGRRKYRRNTYTHTLGRRLTDNNSGAMQWGDRYREFHTAAWREAIRVLDPVDGDFFLNISDHIRKHMVVEVSAWHKATLIDLGLTWLKTVEVETPRLREGANWEARVGHEDIHIFTTRKAA